MFAEFYERVRRSRRPSVALRDQFDTMDGDAVLRFLDASGEFRPPETEPPERVVIDLRLPGPHEPAPD